MKLIRLELRNFKGAEHFILEPNGGDTSVFGDNAAGKTTLADAWYWLLFGKDSANRTDFEIKTIANGQPVNNLSHSVDATLEIGGKELTLTRTYKEKWERERKAAQPSYKGNTTDYKINGVPVKKGEYDAQISSICDEKTFRLLTDPNYFPVTLPWQERRRMLLEICGDVSDADVIASDLRLSELHGILKGRTIDEHKKILDAQQKEINGKLKEIPVRIDEAKRSITDVKEPNRADIESKRTRLLALQDEKLRIASGGQVAEKKRELAEAQAALQERATFLKTQCADEREDAQATRREKTSAITRAEFDLKDLHARKASVAAQVSRLETRLGSVREQFIAAKEQEYSGQDVCAACGQDLPAEKVDAAKERFREARSKKLAGFNDEGKALKAQLESAKEEMQQISKQIEAKENEVADMKIELSAMPEITSVAIDFSSDAEYSELTGKIRTIQDEISGLGIGNQTALNKIEEEIAAVAGAVRAGDQMIAALQKKAETENRIQELVADQKKASAAHEENSRILMLMEDFVRAKVSLLTDRINSKFQLATFKLFDEQVNGGIVECCEATIAGRPFSGALSNAERINVGLDIIGTISDHKGFAPPVFIDNAESVVSLLPTRGQQIRLVVSALDQSLRVETHATTAQPVQEALIPA